MRQDIFQQGMDDIIEQVPGCVGIADDVAIFGEMEEEHDANLITLLETAKREGLVFNSAKCVIKTYQINFFGSEYSDTGIRIDPGKIEDVQAMPTPQDREDLQRFLGLMNFLSAYIPNFAEMSAPLRDLLHKGIPFLWQENHQHAFEGLKNSITAESCLQYYNPDLLTVLEVDASQKGLGACLLQNQSHIAYASKCLSSSQSNYSNIERETLALFFGITRFNTYLFGKDFTVHTDHKLLVMICAKPLTNAPPRLQRLLIKIQGYKFEIEYKPGESMILTDTLSRLPNPTKRGDILLDLRVDGIDFQDVEDIHKVDLINFGSSKREALQVETYKDPVLRGLTQVINTGWPESIKELPHDLRPYWAYRDELGVTSGVVFKGRQVLMPEPLRQDILDQLHTGHMGIERTRRLARESVYWPNINQDIERLVKSCSICQENQPSQQREPLEPHHIPPAPWTKLATDLFEVDQEEYLLVTDYYSKYPVVYRLKTTTSAAVARVTADIFGLLGPPAEIVSDNGPQFIGGPYQDMCSRWAIKHTTSSPRYPQSNGLAERMVRTVKALIKKCKQTGQDIGIAMLHLRATPTDPSMLAPAEVMFGRPIRTTLPSRHAASTLQLFQQRTPDPSVPTLLSIRA